jgi:methionyl-tRNA synthetase
MLISFQANKTVTAVEPWKITTSRHIVHANYVTGIETLRVAGVCLQPILPNAAERILDLLGLERGRGRTWKAVEQVGGTEACEQAKGGPGDIRGVRLF